MWGGVLNDNTTMREKIATTNKKYKMRDAQWEQGQMRKTYTKYEQMCATLCKICTTFKMGSDE